MWSWDICADTVSIHYRCRCRCHSTIKYKYNVQYTITNETLVNVKRTNHQLTNYPINQLKSQPFFHHSNNSAQSAATHSMNPPSNTKQTHPLQTITVYLLHLETVGMFFILIVFRGGSGLEVFVRFVIRNGILQRLREFLVMVL